MVHGHWWQLQCNEANYSQIQNRIQIIMHLTCLSVQNERQLCLLSFWPFCLELTATSHCNCWNYQCLIQRGHISKECQPTCSMYQKVKDISLHVSSTGNWPGGNAIFCKTHTNRSKCTAGEKHHKKKKKKNTDTLSMFNANISSLISDLNIIAGQTLSMFNANISSLTSVLNSGPHIIPV